MSAERSDILHADGHRFAGHERTDTDSRTDKEAL